MSTTKPENQDPTPSDTPPSYTPADAPTYNPHSHPSIPASAAAIAASSRDRALASGSSTDAHAAADDKKLAAMAAWAAERDRANDYYGGIKGGVEGPPTDALKPFRWLGRRLSRAVGREGKGSGESAGEARHGQKEEDFVKDGEVARGDVDSSVVA